MALRLYVLLMSSAVASASAHLLVLGLLLGLCAAGVALRYEAMKLWETRR